MNKELIELQLYGSRHLLHFMFIAVNHIFFVVVFNNLKEERQKNNVLVRRGRGSCITFYLVKLDKELKESEKFSQF